MKHNYMTKKSSLLQRQNEDVTSQILMVLYTENLSDENELDKQLLLC